jgi:hypothetical protein
MEEKHVELTAGCAGDVRFEQGQIISKRVTQRTAFALSAKVLRQKSRVNDDCANDSDPDV